MNSRRSDDDCRTARPHPVSTKNAAARVLLANVQDNILQRHGRRHALFLGLRIREGGAADARRWIGETVALQTTTALHRCDEPRSHYVGFAISADGYRALELQHDTWPRCPVFRAGMKGSRFFLSDPPIEAWDPTLRGPLHAILSLAHNSEEEIGHLLDRLRISEQAAVDIVARERGEVMVDAHGRVIDHFGFATGLSQPLFFTEDIERERNERDGTSTWDPSAGLDLVLVDDPGGRGQHSFGSFMVFRKLEQHPRRFRENEIELARILSIPNSQSELPGALVIGRFRNGMPVVRVRSSGDVEPIPNDFDFASDRDGNKCPFHAHIRKMNPRGDEAALSPNANGDAVLAQERSRRIARRAITYGGRPLQFDALSAPDDLPEGDVGLLFVSFQADIREQFEHLQASWANAHQFPRREPPTGRDPLIGQDFQDGPGRATLDRPPQRWPVVWGRSEPRHVPFLFQSCVSMRGGEYLFAPSVSMLRSLGEVVSKREPPEIFVREEPGRRHGL